jgi:hypothetical protein
MRFIIATLALVASTMANPLSVRQAQVNAPLPLCTGLTANPLCCATDVLGVADLDCTPRKFDLSRTKTAIANISSSHNSNFCWTIHLRLLSLGPASKMLRSSACMYNCSHTCTLLTIETAPARSSLRRSRVDDHALRLALGLFRYTRNAV